MDNIILLVEDDTILAEMYQEKMTMEGLEVVTVSNGKEALKEAKRHPALILLDIMMPGINGFEVLQTLKKDKKTQEIPVIVLTNVGSETADGDKNLALSLGAESYLVKSYHTPDEVIKKVKSLLQARS